MARLQLPVRAGKGNKDRLTMVPRCLQASLSQHRERLRALHERDRLAGLPGVELPEALERKWPKADEKFEWFWMFPSRILLRDHRRGVLRRHHLLDATFQKAIREAAMAAITVAASALERGSEVATFNRRHFGCVPGLKIIEPQ